MLSKADNDLLTQTDAGTPMGELFRRFWIPALLCEEVPEPDSPPVRVRILGEDLVAFRDSEGRVGLIEGRCPHRGAHLFYGRNENCGLRCSYHGWKFAYDGECLDVPTVSRNAGYDRFRQRMRLKSYPVREWGGFVWAYMGPAGSSAELPEMEFALVPDSHRFVAKKFQECNWAQAAEGGLDTAHFSFLHIPIARSPDDMGTASSRVTKGFAEKSLGRRQVQWMIDDARPQFNIRRHPAGMVLGASRRADDGELYWRVSQFLMPCHGYTPSAPAGETYHGQTWVPVDDRSCWVYCYSWNPVRPLTEQERESYRSGGAIYPRMNANWMPLANRSNDYLLDRERQRTENFTGIEGISEQDACIQDSQGRIADRTRENLGPTDAGVVQFRRLMLEAAKGLQAGEPPAAAVEPEAYRVRAGGIVAPEDLPFEEVMQRRFGDEIGRIPEEEIAPRPERMLARTSNA